LKRIAAEGWTPLDLMLHVMRQHAAAGRWDEAAGLAKDVAPYVHPKLPAIQYAAKDPVLQMKPPTIHVRFVKPKNKDEGFRPREDEPIARTLPEGSQ
jgi:hypothetical protein